jgi:hypothetical protein
MSNSSDTLTTALRDRLAWQIAQNAKKRSAVMTPDLVDVLTRWAAEDANPQGLAEWLGNRGGWDKVEAAKVEAALVNAGRVANAGITLFVCIAKDKTDADKTEAHPVVLWYNAARPDPTKPPEWTPPTDRLAAHRFGMGNAAELTKLLDAGRAPVVLGGVTSAGYKLTPETPILWGLDALRVGMDLSDWDGLAQCLTDNKAGDWLGRLASPWLEARRKTEQERLDRAAKAVNISIRPRAETDAGDKWTGMPRALKLAAALGGPFAVEVDGETYASEPEFAGDAVGYALRPRGLDIVPADWLGNPAQMTLNLDLDAPPEALREYVVETAARTAHLAELPNLCPKLLGFMFAAAPMTGRPCKGTLLELARWLYPDWTTNRRSARDLKGLGAAFVAVKGLRLVETKPDGIRHPYDLFTIDYDLSAKPDAAVGFMVNPWLVERMKRGKGGGYFLLNMTRWLALGIQNPRLFPLALRLAAEWDRARVNSGPFVLGRLRPIEADRLAWECNTLPEGAAMYRAGKTDANANKTQLKRARAKLEADLDALQEAGLLGPWEKRKVHGQGFTVLPVPPDDYPEACNRAAASALKDKPKRPRKGKG